MVQKLGNTYELYCSNIAIVDNMYLIAASLKDQELQCIIAMASTIAADDE
ncbi:6777_t:CDS:1, partial [Gigaspora margarita]